MPKIIEDREFLHTLANKLSVLRARVMKTQRSINEEDKDGSLENCSNSLSTVEELLEVLIAKKSEYNQD